MGISVTSLADIENDLAGATPEQLTMLIGDLERVKAKAWAWLMKPGAPEPAPAPPENGRYLTVQEVCDQYKVTPKWLYRHKRSLPFSQPTRKVLLFHEEKIARWFAQRKGHRTGA